MSGNGDLVTGRMVIWSFIIIPAVAAGLIAVIATVDHYVEFFSLSPEQRQEIEAQREEERAVERATAEAQREERRAIRAARKEAEERDQALARQEHRRKGFHCLSGWDGSNRSTVLQVKAVLKDPDSFEHMKTEIAPNVDGWHALRMTYRARNSFGGYNVELIVASIRHTDCRSTISSW